MKPKNPASIPEESMNRLRQATRGEVLYDLADVFTKARQRAIDCDDDAILGRVVTILEGTFVLLQGAVDGDDVAALLGKGATWGKKHVGTSRPRSKVDLARTLRDRVKALPERISFEDVAFEILRSGHVSPLPLVAGEVERRCQEARMAGITDPERIVKRILMAAGISEADAGNWVEAAFRKEG